MSRKRRLERDTAREGRAPALKALAGLNLPKNAKVIQGPVGVKMSDTLLEFADPYIESLEDEDHLNKVLAMTMVAWGMANLPIELREGAIEACMQTLPEEVRADGRTVLAMMMLRKEMYFADNKRTILNYSLTMTPDGPHVDVVSTVTPT
jgi:hypothetical protein